MRLQTLAILCASASFIAVPAFAQQSGQNNDQNQGQNGNTTTWSHEHGTQSSTNPRQMLKSELEKAGFTHIRVEPEAFVVHALNSQGDPVLMRITPDSMEAVTAMKETGHHRSAMNQNKSSNDESSNGQSETTNQ